MSDPDSPAALSGALTVAVPAHGDPRSVVRLISALDLQADALGGRLAVVVSDDASPEPLSPYLTGQLLRAVDLEVVRSEVNGGPGAARNRALASVRTPWVAFFDADELPGDGWLERAGRIAAAPDSPDGVEGRVEVGEQPTPFAHHAEVSTPDGQHVAGNVAFRTELLRKAGGFDERFYDPRRRLHFREDTELYFRLEAAGLRLVFDDDLVAHHPPLPPAFWGTIRLARRYHFDPLLSREHPERFRAFNAVRSVGPVSFRALRHHVALAFGVGALGLLCGEITGRRGLARGGGALLAVGWAGNVGVLGWRRRVRPRDVPALAAAAVLIPPVYLYHYYRGVLAFRHRPRL